MTLRSLVSTFIFELLFIGFIKSGNDSCRFKPLNDLKAILENFIDSAKHTSIKNGKYNVYIVNVYSFDEEEKEMGFTFGYIENEYDLDSIDEQLIGSIDGEIVLIVSNVSNKVNALENIDCLNFKRIQDSDLVQVRTKLYPRKKGGITGISIGWTYYTKKDATKIVYYKNSDEITSDKSIFSSLPKVNIKRIK